MLAVVYGMVCWRSCLKNVVLRSVVPGLGWGCSDELGWFVEPHLAFYSCFLITSESPPLRACQNCWERLLRNNYLVVDIAAVTQGCYTRDVVFYPPPANRHTQPFCRFQRFPSRARGHGHMWGAETKIPVSMCVAVKYFILNDVLKCHVIELIIPKAFDLLNQERTPTLPAPGLVCAHRF